MDTNRITNAALLLLALSCIPAAVAPVGASQSSLGRNLAHEKTYRLSPAPNYRYCTDPDDVRQLTDGETTDQYFWTQEGTVGWQHVRYATVTVDLGRVEPIGGVSLTTAAGVAGVTWPMAVQILVSDDGRTFYDAGDLVALDRQSHGPWPAGYAIRRLRADRLAARGRFVQFVLIPLAGGPYLFTDEIQVFRGPDALLDQQPDPATATDAGRVYEQGRLARSLRHRWLSDLESVEGAIAGSPLDTAAREELLHRLKQLRTAGPDQIGTDADLRITLPIGQRHAQLFQVQAALWRATGRGELTAWAANPWDPLDPFEAPPVSSDAGLAVDAMRGEFRSAVVNLANSTDRPLVVRLQLQSLPGAPMPDFVTLHEVAWTDTSQGVPIAAALPEAVRDDDAWRVTVLPGLVRQVWISFHPTAVDPGRHEGQLSIQWDASQAQQIPLSLRIWPLEMPQEKSLWLGGWSYTDGDARYGMTARNKSDFVRHLQDHFVNAPWATSGVLMSFEFDQDPAKIRLDTASLDRWLDLWPDAKAYLVFLSVAHYSGAIRSSLGGADIDSAEFQQRVGTWISAWVKHLRSRGIEPNRLGLLIHDEPHEGSDLGPLLAWARAIQAAEPEVIIWEDPTYREPAAAPAELFDVCDVLCPNRPMWLERGEPFAAFYQQQRQRGRTLQFYSCSGPAKLLDPYSYHRLQAWHSWHAGGTGSFFWAFGDNGGASSWNEYYAAGGPFTPLFLDETTVTAGKHMEAIRESVQDYEYLVMLQDAVRKAKSAGGREAAVARGEKLLERAAIQVLDAEGATALKWHEAKDRSVADRIRPQILEALTALQ